MDHFNVTAHASSTDEAEHLMRRDFGPVALFIGDLTYDARIAGDDRFSMAAIQLGGSFDVDVDLDTVMMVTATGEYGWEFRGESGDLGQSPGVVEPGEPWRGTLRNADLRFASLSMAPLERAAQAMFADDRLRVRFDQRAPVSDAYARSIRKTLHYAAHVAETDAFDSDLVRASLYRLLSATLLHGFAFSGDPADRALNSAALLRGYQRAITFIDDHASLPITMEDIAAAAGLSTKQLNYAFSAHSFDGSTASKRLRAARLSAAHQELVLADPTLGDTVSAIAVRWGFSPSNFAAAHRKMYGANPKQVLDR